MNIYIMTRGRVGKQTTRASIPPSLLDRTYLVCPSSEIGLHGNDVKLMPVPPEIDNYSKKFQWIMKDGMGDGNKKCLILDDDLVFSTRNETSTSLITVRTPHLLELMFKQIEDLIDEHPLVGVHPRQMGQNARGPYVLNGRIICIQGINRLYTGDIKVDQFPILADVVLNLTLLSRGLSNALITTFFQDHGPCQAPGGCSLYRTPEMQKSAVEYLARRWPGYVKTVVRKPKVAKWMGEERTEYTAQWKKLYAAGIAWATGQGPNPDMGDEHAT